MPRPVDRSGLRRAAPGAPRRRHPGGRLRFDALVRYLQDVANDDTRDAGFDDVMGWVVRRTVIEVDQLPRLPGGAGAQHLVQRRREPLGRAAGAGGSGTRVASSRPPPCGSTWTRDDAAEGPAGVVPRSSSGRRPGGRTVRARCSSPETPTTVSAKQRRSRCGSRTSTCSATSTTPSTGRRSRRSWPAGASCGRRCGPSSSTEPRSSRARRSRSWWRRGPTGRRCGSRRTAEVYATRCSFATATAVRGDHAPSARLPAGVGPP